MAVNDLKIKPKSTDEKLRDAVLKLMLEPDETTPMWHQGYQWPDRTNPPGSLPPWD